MEELKAKMEARREQLLESKAKGGKNWTDDLQAELDGIAVTLVDVDEVISEKKAKAELAKPVSEKDTYKVPKGSENVVHARICKGRRFNPNTGVEESKSYIQMFTIGEWNLFKQFHQMQGYHILEVLYNPFEK